MIASKLESLKIHLMGWLWLVGSIKLQVSFAKELYKRDNILQKRPMILLILLAVATPWPPNALCKIVTRRRILIRCLKLQVFLGKRATNQGALLRKCPIKIRHPMHLRHPVWAWLHRIFSSRVCLWRCQTFFVLRRCSISRCV